MPKTCHYSKFPKKEPGSRILIGNKSRKSAQNQINCRTREANSGLSQERYCQDHAISYGSFQTWRKKLREKFSGDSAGAHFFEVPRTEQGASPEPLPLDQGLRVRLELGTGVVLELSRV